MDERGFTDMLNAAIHGWEPEEIRRTETYEEAGVLTTNHGLVITLNDGAEFQVTVVQSKRG